MAINFQYQNPTGPMAVGGYMDAKKMAYNSGRAQDSQNALNQQRENQARGAQQFSQQMYGMANQMIAAETQSQRDTALFNNAAIRSKQENTQAMDLYRNRVAIENGFMGSETTSPWQAAQAKADETAGGDISKLFSTRALDAKEAELEVVGRLKTVQAVEQETQLQQAKLQVQHDEEAYNNASQPERSRIDDLRTEILRVNDPKDPYRAQWSKADLQQQDVQLRSDLREAYGQLRTRTPPTLQEQVDSKKVIAHDRVSGALITTPDVRVQTRATALSPVAEYNRQISEHPVGSVERQAIEANKNAYIESENSRRKSAAGVKPEEIDTITYDDDGIIKSINRTNPQQQRAESSASFNLILKTMLEAEKQVITKNPDGTTKREYVQIYTPDQAVAAARKAMAAGGSLPDGGGGSGDNAQKSRSELLAEADAAMKAGNLEEARRLLDQSKKLKKP